MTRIIALMIVFLFLIAGAIAQDNMTAEIIEEATEDVVEDVNMTNVTEEAIEEITEEIMEDINMTNITQAIAAEAAKPQFFRSLGNNVYSHLDNVLDIQTIIELTLIILITVFLFRMLNKIIKHYARKRAKYRLKLLGTLPIIKIFIIIFLTAYILTQVLNFPHATLVAILASAGLAIGIGAMDIVKNMFGGAVVILSRPFQIGDRITINEHYGEVVEIRFLHTRIKQIDNALVSIPNSLFISKEVKNQNYGSIDCPIIIDFWIPGDSDPKQVKKLLYEATITSKYVNLDKGVIIYIDDVIKQVQIQHYKIKVYVFDTSYEFDFRTDVTEVVKQKLHDMGFPLYTGEDRRFVGHEKIFKD